MFTFKKEEGRIYESVYFYTNTQKDKLETNEIGYFGSSGK